MEIITMKLASLHTGQDLILNNVPYRLIRMLEDGQCQLERKSDLALSSYSKQELLGFLSTGQLVLCGQQSLIATTENDLRFDCDLSAYPEAIQQQVFYRFNYVKKADELYGENVTCQGLSRVIKSVAQECNDPHPPSPLTVYRWWKRWIKADRSITVLIKNKRGPKNKRRIIRELAQEAQQLIEEIYLKREGGSIQDVYDALDRKIRALNSSRNTPIPTPSRATVYRYIATYDQHLVMAARKGKQAADRHYRATGKGPEPEYILERAEVDHTPLDLLIIDDVTGLTIGRPTVTFIIDRYSRLPLGFEVGFEPPSELAVMRALRRAILPKTYVAQEYSEVENEWLAYGIPSNLVCDNGLEFHSHQLRRMCAELNIELTFCPKKQPHYKGAIERFLGTFNRQVSHKVEGTTFSNIEQRGDYDADKSACLTLAEFKKLLHVWLIDVYIQTPHKSLGITPALAWKDGLKMIEPVLPESKEKLDLILSIQKSRQLNHEGVQLKGLMYNSSELATLRKLGIAKVNIRINSEDLGEIWVFDEHQGDYLRVPCTYAEYASKLTLAQHLLIRQHNNQTNAERVDIDLYQRGKDKLRQLIEEVSNSKKLSKRKKAARYKTEGLNLAAFSSNTLPEKVSEQSDKDYRTDDIPDFDVDSKETDHV
ncbi:MAG: DDE-type integrase/transposase/recombinase [Methylobacter sp.]|uniref:Mu transposase C-terminal domain-containing protein n=1 Tax=Methylobacter sp. TaxID=2051955 RepID=UPI0025F010D7|nr:Mu transposase C-terminal domain-containing protein [Methylobacter sp.]MCK9621783.1 DDE-type integrase/transposase/recombinase [Methylobacter sp.]